MSDLISRKEIIDRLERVIQNGVPSEDGMHPISAEMVLEVVRGLSEHGTNLAEVGTDCISRQAAIDALRAMQTYKLFAGDDMLLIDQAGAQTELMLLPPIRPDSCSENPNSTDVISRQAAKNAICNACGKIDCDEMDTCKKLVIPSEGSKALGWQYHTYIPHNKYCPKCGKDSPYNKRWKFCPNCGEKMEVNNEIN